MSISPSSIQQQQQQPHSHHSQHSQQPHAHHSQHSQQHQPHPPNKHPSTQHPHPSSSPNNQVPLTPLQNLIAGAGSGLLTRCVVAPLDVLKVRFQLQTNRGEYYRSIPHALYRIVRDEGALALWKGNLLASMMASPYTGLAMTSQKWLKNNCFSDPNSTTANAMSGAGAGIVATGLTYPFDLLRSRFIAQKGTNGYTSIWHALTTIYTTQGPLGIFEGITPALIGIIPYMAVQFAVYEGSKDFLTKNVNVLESMSGDVVDSIQRYGGKIGLTSEQCDNVVKWTKLESIQGGKASNNNNNNNNIANTNSSLTTSSQLLTQSESISDHKLTSNSSNINQNNTMSSTITSNNNNNKNKNNDNKKNNDNNNTTPLWLVPIIGFISGASGKAVSFPMDLLKRRMQMSSFQYTFDTNARPTTTNMLNVAKHIWKTEGFLAFYKGLVPSLLKSGPSASLVFLFYEAIVKVMVKGQYFGKKNTNNVIDARV